MAAALFAPGTALAQGAAGYPSKPVTVILPYAPGSSLELETRMYTQKLAEALQQNFVIDHKPGAGAISAMAALKKSPADGHALFVASTSITISAVTVDPMPHDLLKDLSWIAMMSKRPTFLLVHESLPIKTLAEYIAYARANPGKLNFGTAGAAGSSQHIAGVRLHQATKSEVTFVHYKSSGAMAPDFTAGRVNVGFSTPITAANYIKTGKLRPLGVTSTVRSALMPDLPAISEQVPGYESSGWMGFAAPSATPPAIINKLNGELVKAARAADITQKLGVDGVQTVASSPEEFRQFIAADLTKWRDFIKTSGIKISGD